MFDSLRLQGRTVGVLARRELQTRFGYNPFGMVLTILQPLAIIVAMATIRYVLSGGIYHGMGIIPFIATGVLTFQAFRDTASRVMGSGEANRNLLYLPQVSALDIAIGSFVFQFCWWLSLSAIVTLGIVLIDPVDVPQDYLTPMLIIMTATMLGFAFGLLIGALRRYAEVFYTVSQILMTPMLFLSGVFFVLAELPPEIHGYLTWNPVLHLNELMRAAYFDTYQSDVFDAQYVAIWILLLLLMGLVVERVSRDRIRL